MTRPRRLLVDVDVTRYYHCISRCVRRAFLCGEGFEHRKSWIESRLEVLAKNFAASVCGFAVMDNHLHVLCRLDPGVADDWTDEEVVRRWITVYPQPNLDADNTRTAQAWVEDQCKDSSRVAKYRERLQDLGWFMKALKEPLARLANKEDNCKGTFWEARYKSIAIDDDEALRCSANPTLPSHRDPVVYNPLPYNQRPRGCRADSDPTPGYAHAQHHQPGGRGRVLSPRRRTFAARRPAG